VGSAKKGVNYLDFKLKTELGDIVPEVNERDIITVRSGGNEVFKGRFYFD